ncbi:MAG: ParA family protein [Chloroflexi bacterium]|nr:ParA family protein [Chloroflexota bacterium]
MSKKVMTIENRKGGVGKTTTAVSLAVGLAQRLNANGGGNVLLIDLDAQGDAARALGLDPGNRCVSQVLQGRGTQADMQANVMAASQSGGYARPNLYVLPASDRLAEAKTGLVADVVARQATATLMGQTAAGVGNLVDVLEEKFSLLKQAFTFIILDCPPTLDILQKAVHQFADTAVVPVKIDYHGTSATGRHTANILQDQSEGIDIAIEAIVPTFVDRRNNLTKIMMRELIKVYGRNLIAQPVPNTVRVAEAPSLGATILEYQPHSPAAEAYYMLVERIYNGAK